MSSWVSVGVDNGLTGAVVCISDQYQLLGYWDTPVINLGVKGKQKNEFAPATMCQILSLIKKEHIDRKGERVMVWLEVAQAMPKQGLSSTFKTGRGFGLWEGICAGLGLEYDIVHPRTWTKFMLKDIPAGEPKSRSMAKCQRLFPELPLTKPRGKVLSLDGRSDAALIAYYGMLQMKGRSEVV